MFSSRPLLSRWTTSPGLRHFSRRALSGRYWSLILRRQIFTLRTLRDSSFVLLWIFAPGLYILRNHVEIMTIRGNSMAPALSPSARAQNSAEPLSQDKCDHVVFRKNLRLYDFHEDGTAITRGVPIRRGSVVYFRTPHDPEKVAVKRVVGIAGDRVVPLLPRPDVPRSRAQRETTLIVPPEGVKASGKCPRPGAQQVEPVLVPYNHVWLEGDNRRTSIDSNDYGPVSLAMVQGVATCIVLPVSRSGLLELEDDGWEERMKGRLVKRRNDQEWQYPEEWLLH